MLVKDDQIRPISDTFGNAKSSQCYSSIITGFQVVCVKQLHLPNNNNSSRTHGNVVKLSNEDGSDHASNA